MHRVHTNFCNKGGLPILQAVVNMHVYLLCTNFYGALPENMITDHQCHKMLILAFTFAWQNLKKKD
jgi:hypothetical protein